VQPLAGAIENVPRFLKSGEFVALKDNLEGQGFTVVSGLVSALDLGVAQRRIRGVVLFARGIVPRLPKRKPRRKPTVRRALRGFRLSHISSTQIAWAGKRKLTCRAPLWFTMPWRVIGMFLRTHK